MKEKWKRIVSERDTCKKDTCDKNENWKQGQNVSEWKKLIKTETGEGNETSDGWGETSKKMKLG